MDVLSNPAKVLRKHTVASVTLETAWKTWTTVEGVTSFFAPKANIEAQAGGRYELLFYQKAPRGFQGTEGCKVLSIDPPKGLAFEFLARPEFPNARRIRTRVDVLIEQVLGGGLVKFSVVHSGFLEGEEWDECFELFNWDWEVVLGRLQYRFYAGPIDWSHPYMPLGIGSRPLRKLREHVSM